MQLKIDVLSGEAFAPFGVAITQPQTAPQASGQGWQWWGHLALLPGAGDGCGIGYLDLQPAGPVRIDWAERHADTYEFLAPAGEDCLLYVAPADHPDELNRLPPLDRFRLFRVRPGQAVVLNPKVWHGAPLALEQPTKVMVALRWDTGPDNSCIVPFASDVIEAAG